MSTTRNMPERKTKRWLRRSALLAVLTLAVTGFGEVAADRGSKNPTPDEIIRRGLARAKWVKEEKPDLKYTYTLVEVVEKLGEGDTVKERNETTYEAVLLDGYRYFRLVGKDGKSLAAKDLKREQERERKFRERIAKKPLTAHDDENLEFNEELVSRYTFTLAGKEMVNGRSTFVLTFEPKSSRLPMRKPMDKLLNNLAGQVWIDEQDYEVARVEAKLIKEVGFGWGLLGNLRRFDFHMEQVRLDDGTWMMSHFQMYLDGRKLFSRLHLRQKNLANHFKKVA